MKMVIPKASFDDIVRVICKNPRMYLMHGTFGEVLAFLEGYGKGVGFEGPGSSGSVFSPFKKWLCKRSWENSENFWRSFRDAHGDEQTAITEFAKMWSEYEVERNSDDEIVSR